MTIEDSNSQVEPSWFIDENLPGVGDRPSWLPEKFKTVADLSKSYSELEKRVGVPPENYDFTKSKFLDADYAPFQELQTLAKEKRVPQEFIDGMLSSIDKYMDEFTVDMNEEMKKLGENGQERVKTLDNWAKANLSQNAYEALTGSLTNAESIKALEELRGRMMSDTTQIPNDNGTVASAASLDDVKMELSNNLQKYKTDDAYRKDIQRRLEVAARNAPGYVDKVGA